MKKTFSLIELLTVIALLGIAVFVLVPRYGNIEHQAKNQAAAHQMVQIREAFCRLNEDCALCYDEKRLEQIEKYGLYPLFVRGSEKDPNLFEPYDLERQCGWNGPYLNANFVSAEIYTPSDQSYGQMQGIEPGLHRISTGGGTLTVPAIQDPFGGRYRLLAPGMTSNGTELERLNRLCLVCTGADKVLNTTVQEVEKFFNHPPPVNPPSETGLDPAVYPFTHDGISTVHDDRILPLFTQRGGL